MHGPCTLQTDAHTLKGPESEAHPPEAAERAALDHMILAALTSTSYSVTSACLELQKQLQVPSNGSAGSWPLLQKTWEEERNVSSLDFCFFNH